VWDVDGKEYVDFHDGFGVMCVGHANPVIAEAVKRRVEQGTHFAAPTNRRLLGGCDEIIGRCRLPCYTEGLGAKGCVVFSPEPLREYRDYLTKVDDDLSTLAWLHHMNNGVFMTPGVEEEWTLSLAHTDAHVRHYLDAFEAFARSLSG
jgi:glutamate-1-semialdehyde 2,1-aminomutase